MTNQYCDRKVPIMEFVTPNWTNLLTTAFGFILFVWVLRKYAWGPVLGLLDERRGKVEGDYEAAEKHLSDAEQLKVDFESKLSDIKTLEREKVQEAVKRGEEVADGIVVKARTGAEEIRVKADQDIEIESQKARIELRDSVVTMAIGAAEKVIDERMDDDLHRKLITDYIEVLEKGGHSKGDPDA
jgi:F-type H+-transporting ATPase subunit b